MLSHQGYEKLSKLFEEYRQEHIKAWPGCSEADIEKDFFEVCEVALAFDVVNGQPLIKKCEQCGATNVPLTNGFCESCACLRCGKGGPMDPWGWCARCSDALMDLME